MLADPTTLPKRRIVSSAFIAIASCVLGLAIAPVSASATSPPGPAEVARMATRVLAVARAAALEQAARGPAPAVVAPALVRAEPADTAAAALDALEARTTADYEALLIGLADQVGPLGEVAPDELARVWLATDARRMTAVLSALTQLGVGYRYASSEPGVAFDCSGLTSWAWSQAGIDIPHQSRSQINVAKRLDIDEARPGDLLYYPGHVMLALGLGDAVVHAVKPGTPVEVKSQRRRGGRLLAGSVVTGDVPDDGALDGA